MNSQRISTSVKAAPSGSGATLLACPACGTRARRSSARYCATCGRGLDELGYLPADTLRASYHHQQQHPPFMPGHQPHPACVARPLARKPAERVCPRVPQTGATGLARAFVIWALVPYLGILFCPCAVVCGGIGILRAPQRASARSAMRCILLSLVIFGAQLFLWGVLLS